MAIKSVRHLSDGALWHQADTLEAQERGTMAQLLVCIAELDARKLYVEAGFSSMHACCLERWRMSEDMAYRRITAARLGRRFPVIFDGLADGRFNLTGLLVLATHLRDDVADELLAEAASKTRREIESLIARRLPQPDLPTVVTPIAARSGGLELAPARVANDVARMNVPSPQLAPARVGPEDNALAPERANLLGSLAPERVAAQQAVPATTTLPPVQYPHVVERAPERFALQLTMDRETHDLLREAQALSNLPAQADIPEVLKRALRQYVARLKQRKLGATAKPRPQKARRDGDPRYVPAAVRRAVVKRDRNRCTYVGDTGTRCTATTRLEFDHILSVARGGESTVDNLRQRCRAHNQLEAEHEFGAAFMTYKREAARRHAAGPPAS